MTLILLRIDNQLQSIVGLKFITGTKDFMVTTQSTNNDQKTTFICSPESTHYPFIEAILKNTPLNHIKSHNGKFYTTVRNRHFYLRRLGVWKRRTHHLNIWMHRLEITISQSHTITPLNRVNLNWKWTSINMRECKITNIYWLPERIPLQVRIDPVENLPTVIVIPIPARTAEFANLFVTLTIPGRNLATPILDPTENQRLVDLLAYMEANIGTYTGVSLINLLQEICNRFDLEFGQKTRKVGEFFKTPTKSWQSNQSASPLNKTRLVGHKCQLWTTDHQNPNSWT